MGTIVSGEFALDEHEGKVTITRESDGKQAVIFGDDVPQFWQMMTELQRKRFSTTPYVRRVFFAARGE